MPMFCLCTLAWLFHFWNCNYRGFRTNEVRRVNSARKKKTSKQKRKYHRPHDSPSLSEWKEKKQKEEKTIIRSGKLGGLQNSQDLYQWAQLTFWTGIRAGKLTKNERYNHNHTISCELEHPRETNIGGTHCIKQPRPQTIQPGIANANSRCHRFGGIRHSSISTTKISSQNPFLQRKVAVRLQQTSDQLSLLHNDDYLSVLSWI